MTLQTCNLVPRYIVRHTLSPHLLPLFLLLLLQARWGSCHPQCLDYKPPFEPQQPLVFCKEYTKFGCCDLEKDAEISVRFYSIMDNFDHSGFTACGRYIRSILCQVSKQSLSACFSHLMCLCGHFGSLTYPFATVVFKSLLIDRSACHFNSHYKQRTPASLRASISIQ